MIVVYVLLAIFAAVALSLLLRVFLRKETVYEFEKGLLYRKGHFISLLSPGQYYYTPLFTRIDKVDMRLRTVTVPGQEVSTSDNVTLKISLAVVYKVSDPALSAHSAEDPRQALYAILQLALRDLASKAKADELIEKRDEIAERLHEIAQRKFAELGLTAHTIGVKDFMFPGEFKRIFAQVVKAQKEGLAALEKARGETAALRSLANAAKMLENNPALMQLRLIQSLSDNAGNSLVWGVPQSVVPVAPAGPKPPQNGKQEA